MSDRPDLSEALALAQARGMSSIAKPRSPAPEATTIELLRVAALVHGFAPDDVERSFLQGGPLAELVRAVLGTEAGPLPKLRGRPRKLAETWDTFIRVLGQMRSGLTQEDAVARVAADTGLEESTVRSRFTRTRDEDGVSLESIPNGLLAAYFADPRPVRRDAKR